METPETEINYIPPAEPSMVLSQEAQYYLQLAAKWATFISIVGFIWCGFSVITAMFAGAVFTAASKFSTGPDFNPLAIMGPFVGVILFLVTGIMFYITLCLYQFGSNAKKAIAFNDSELLIKTFRKLRAFFKANGIILIICISIYVLFFVFAIAAGVGGLMGRH